MFPYSVDHASVLSRVAFTNIGFGTAYRGYGSPQAYTASEALVDMLAEKIGMDPFEIRWRNIARPGDTNIASHEYRDYPMEEMMKKLKPLYEEAKLIAEKESTPEKKRGVGILGEASMFPTSLMISAAWLLSSMKTILLQSMIHAGSRTELMWDP